MKLEPYVFLEGRCEEAIEFYKKTLGAEVQMALRYKDSPTPPQHVPPGGGEKIMHASLKIGESRLLASDGHCSNKATFQGFGLSLSAKTVEEGQKLFNSLADGGQPLMPFAKTFFSPGFGMVADRFGIMWMVVVDH